MRLLLVCALAVSGCKAEDAPKPPAQAERWGGAIFLPQQQPLEFEVTLEPAKGTITIPAQGLKDQPLEAVTFDAKTIVFTIDNPNGDGVFTLERMGADKAEGTLVQGGASLEVRMRPLADGEHVGDGTRPQDPEPPFPYTTREASYPSADGTTLAGTLTIPPGDAKHPAVILVSGSGVQDRNGEMFGHRGFWVLADHLTRRGIAVLRVDDRGIGGSGGDTMAASIQDKVADVEAGIAWLSQQPEIDPRRIGLIGHSEGGAIVPIAAGRAPIAALVLLGAPGVTGAELAMTQVEAQLRASGVDAKLIEAQLAGQNKLIDLQLAGADAAALRAAATELVDHVATLVAPDQRAKYEGAARDAMIETSVAALDSRAQRSFSALDPAVALSEHRGAPVLALTGSLDLQVDPTINLEKIRAALARAGNPDVTIEVLPGLNHLFQPAKTGLTAEYPLIDTTFDPAALDKITAWLKPRMEL